MNPPYSNPLALKPKLSNQIEKNQQLHQNNFSNNSQFSYSNKQKINNISKGVYNRPKTDAIGVKTQINKKTDPRKISNPDFNAYTAAQNFGNNLNIPKNNKDNKVQEKKNNVIQNKIIEIPKSIENPKKIIKNKSVNTRKMKINSAQQNNNNKIDNNNMMKFVPRNFDNNLDKLKNSSQQYMENKQVHHNMIYSAQQQNYYGNKYRKGLNGMINSNANNQVHGKGSDKMINSAKQIQKENKPVSNKIVSQFNQQNNGKRNSSNKMISSKQFNEEKKLYECLYLLCICLSDNDELKRHLLHVDKYHIKKEKKNGNLSFFLSQVVSNINKDKSFELKPLFEKICEINRYFKDNLDKNIIIDYLIFMLNELFNDDILLKNIKINDLNENTYQNINNYIPYLDSNEKKSSIFRKYSWINEKIIKCLGCEKENKSYAYYFTYDLNFISTINKILILKEETKNNQDTFLTIEQSIKYSLEEERLYNIYCPNCDIKTTKIRNSSIYSTNDYFILLFKDLERNIDLLKNNNIKIKIEKQLDMDKLQKEKKGKNIYEIHSITFYDTSNKKYVTYSYRPSYNDWMIYPDKIPGIKDEKFLFIDDFKFIPMVIFYNILK